MNSIRISKINLERNIPLTSLSLILSFFIIFLVLTSLKDTVSDYLAFILVSLPIIFLIPSMAYDLQYSSVTMTIDDSRIIFIKNDKIIKELELSKIIKVKEIEVSISRIIGTFGGLHWFKLVFYTSENITTTVGRIPIAEYENINLILNQYNLKIENVKNKTKAFY